MGGSLAGLVRVALRWLGAMRSAARWAAGVFRKPGWQGWGTILTGLTFLATIAVALALIYYAQQEEQRRWEESQANFSVSVALTRLEGVDGRWVLDLSLFNLGPAAAGPVLIALEVGDPGINVLQPPSLSSGTVVRFMPYADPDGEAYHLRSGSFCDLRVDEPVLPGEALVISQEFAVEGLRDVEFQQDPSLAERDPHLGLLLPTRRGLSTGLHKVDSSPSLIGSFLGSLVILGGNVFFSREW